MHMAPYLPSLTAATRTAVYGQMCSQLRMRYLVQTFTTTPRRSRLVGAGPSMPKRSFSSHPGEPQHLLHRIYRSPTASGGQQHSTEYGARARQHAAYLSCHASLRTSPYGCIFSGSVKAEGSTFLLTDGLLILYATHVQLPNRRFPAANPLLNPTPLEKCPILARLAVPRSPPQPPHLRHNTEGCVNHNAATGPGQQ
eukprot:COSAG01_NODE_2924_length_6842_cov_3.862821_4_plen_197_part_00